MKIGLQTWGSEGDVRPFLNLAAVLTEAGHRVTLLVSDDIGRDYSAEARANGFELRATKPILASFDIEAARIWREILDAGHPLRQAELILRYGFDPLVDAMYEGAVRLCAENEAVVGHFFVHPLRAAAQASGTPFATVHIAPECLPSLEFCPTGIPDLGRWMRPFAWWLVARLIDRVFLRRTNALRARAGLPPDRDTIRETWVSDRLNLVAISPTLCAAPADWKGRYEVCGFFDRPTTTAAEPIPEAIAAFLAEGAPPVYFTFGSMMVADTTYIAETVAVWRAAVARLGCRAIFQVPHDGPEARPTEPNILIARRAPHAEVFPRCALVVHHGGAGTTQSALRAGRASVVVAHMTDQFDWGARLERLGVAGPTRTRRRLTANDLAASIAKVLTAPAMANRARSLGQSMSTERGPDKAVRLIETRLR